MTLAVPQMPWAKSGVIAAAICFGAPATAANFTPPEGCAAFLSVQSRGCTVSHYWICEGDPEGTHWRISFDQEGAFHLSFTDQEFRWLKSFDLRSDLDTVLVEPETDPASLSELLETGRDTMTFTLRRSQDGFSDERAYTGFDALTGQQVIVDGLTLEQTEFAYQYDGPDGPVRTRGNQFVSRDLRIFFGGVEEVILPSGETIAYDASPVEFAREGEAGFLDSQPRFDCGEIVS